MKNILTLLIVLTATIGTAFSQKEFHIYMNDGTSVVLQKDAIDKIQFSQETNSTPTNTAQWQMNVNMKDGSYTTYALSKITGGTVKISLGDAIDLGLPSGTKWASHNLGASRPEEYGGYYAWGEITEKEEYTSQNYEFFYKDYYPFIDIGDDIKGTGYDVAHIRWGGKWFMPSASQCKELVEYCKWECVQNNSISGQLVTGPNGHSIFIPCAGCKSNKYITDKNTNGHYWSSTIQDSPGGSSDEAQVIYFGWGAGVSEPALNWWDRRSLGYTIRPVQ